MTVLGRNHVTVLPDVDSSRTLQTCHSHLLEETHFSSLRASPPAACQSHTSTPLGMTNAQRNKIATPRIIFDEQLRAMEHDWVQVYELLSVGMVILPGLRKEEQFLVELVRNV